MSQIDYRVAQAIVDLKRDLYMNRPANAAFNTIIDEMQRLKDANDASVPAAYGVIAAVLSFVAGMGIGVLFA